MIHIPNNAFRGNDYLVSVEIPDSVRTIGANAFSNCSNLSSISIGNNVEIIGAEVFKSCRRLKSVVIPDSVRSLGNGAFINSSVSSVVIGNGLYKKFKLVHSNIAIIFNQLRLVLV